jgi:hypothetical protein
LHRRFRWLAARIVVIDTLVLFVLQLGFVSDSVVVQIFHHLHVPESLGLIDWSFAPSESISSYVGCTASEEYHYPACDSHRERTDHLQRCIKRKKEKKEEENDILSNFII